MTRFNVLCVYIALIFSYFDSWIIELFSSFCFMNFLQDRCHLPTRGASWTSFPIQKKIGVIFKNPHFSSVVHVTITSVGVVGGKREHAMSLCKLHQSHQISSVVLSHEIGTSQPAAPHVERQPVALTGRRLPCVRSVLWDWHAGLTHEMRSRDTACMVDHAWMFDHAR